MKKMNLLMTSDHFFEKLLTSHLYVRSPKSSVLIVFILKFIYEFARTKEKDTY